MSNLFEDEIKAVNAKQKKLNESAKESKDVKDGLVTEEEELKEPSYVLFNSIMDTIKKIMEKDDVVKSTENIINAILSTGGNKSAAVKELINLLIVVISTASYESILCYDEMLKEELTRQFDGIVNYINMVKADTDAHSGVLSVFKKHLSEIDNILKVNELRKNVDN